MRYKVTARELNYPFYFNAESKDDAWTKAEKLAKQNGVALSDGTVIEVPTEAEKDAEIARLRQLLRDLAGDFPGGVYSNALGAARAELEKE